MAVKISENDQRCQHHFIHPYYYEQLDNTDLEEIREYISNLSEDDYKHNEFDYYDSVDDQNHKKYRHCEIHYPKTSPESENLLYRIGKKIIRSLNERNYQYDLDDVFEFQLIKYYEGGNYNWHCDYGSSPRIDVVRKLSMTMQLSDPKDYEGGELHVVDYSNRVTTMEKYMGRVLVFDSKLPHKVHPVTSGKRIALVGWASGPQLR